MKELVHFLEKSKVQYLATIGLDGKPKVRPFQFMFEEEGKIWFCTANTKEVYKELQNQPWVEFCASGKNMSWMRLEGKVVFSDELRIKAKVFEHSSLVKSIYKEPVNPAFEVFYLAEVKASISSIGKAPRVLSI